MAAGEYRDRFAWSVHSYGTQDAMGEPADVYTPSGYLWGILEDQVGSEEEVLGNEQNRVRARVRLRSKPNVQRLDLLTLAGDAWEVQAVWSSGLNEITVEVLR